MIELKPPTKYSTIDRIDYSIFLAGSIEMGTAENWQQKVVKSFKGYDDSVVIFNPRRDNWDSSWKQVKTNKKFREQVEWELDNLEKADAKLFYFDPNTLSQVSMMELGLFGQDYNTYVVCPKGFHRKGNIDIVCEKYSIPTFSSLNAAIRSIKFDLELTLN